MVNPKLDAPAVVLSGNLGEQTYRWALNEAALAISRSLGRRGVKVYRFHPDRSLADLCSRYIEHIPCPNLYDDPAGLVNALVQFAKDLPVRPVLFPASDGAAQFVAAHEDELRQHFALTCPSFACLKNAQNKQELLTAASRMGVPIPKTYFPMAISELDGIAESLSYPVIVKPLFSADWKRPKIVAAIGPRKALTISTPGQLVDLCGRLMSLSNKFMIQEIVPGPIENLLTFVGYMGRDGEVMAGCVRSKMRQSPPGFGYCCLTETVDDKEIFDLSVTLFKALGYTGIGCVEFKRDPRDGKPKLIEINTRSVRTSALPIAAGVDFPWVAYCDLTDPDNVVLALDYKIGVRWVHVKDELNAATRMMAAGELSFTKWVKGYFGKPLVSAEFSWDDTVPALVIWSQLPGKLIRLAFQRLKRKDAEPAGNLSRANK